jgi:hypothetical protein
MRGMNRCSPEVLKWWLLTRTSGRCSACVDDHLKPWKVLRMRGCSPETLEGAAHEMVEHLVHPLELPVQIHLQGVHGAASE